MGTDELQVGLEATRESLPSHLRSMTSVTEEEIFKRVRRELDRLIFTVRQREIDILMGNKSPRG
jgi:hypothetical protein